MTNTPIIDNIIVSLEYKGIEVNKKPIIGYYNKRTYHNKNKLRKSKRNLLINLPKQDS